MVAFNSAKRFNNYGIVTIEVTDPGKENRNTTYFCIDIHRSIMRKKKNGDGNLYCRQRVQFKYFLRKSRYFVQWFSDDS